MPQLALAAHYFPTQPAVVRLALIGVDPLARAGIYSMLAGYDDLEIAQELDLADALRPRAVAAHDATLFDAASDSASLVSIPQLGEPVLVLIGDPSMAGEALAHGARGVLLRSASPKRIHAALRAVSEGLMVLDDELSSLVAPHASVSADDEIIEPLTQREREVMQLLASGLTNKEIANRLGISEHTVKFHVNGILGKLGAETRTEAVVHAARLGIVVL